MSESKDMHSVHSRVIQQNPQTLETTYISSRGMDTLWCILTMENYTAMKNEAELHDWFFEKGGEGLAMGKNRGLLRHWWCSTSWTRLPKFILLYTYDLSNFWYELCFNKMFIFILTSENSDKQDWITCFRDEVKKAKRLKQRKSWIHQWNLQSPYTQSTCPGPWMLTPRPPARASVMILDILLTPLGICHFSPQHIKKRQSAKHMDVLERNLKPTLNGRSEKQKASTPSEYWYRAIQYRETPYTPAPTNEVPCLRVAYKHSDAPFYTDDFPTLPKVQILSASRWGIKWTISEWSMAGQSKKVNVG